MNNREQISGLKLLCDNGDGLYLAAFALRFDGGIRSSECIFLGDYTGRETECGQDFAAVNCGSQDAGDVRDWNEPAWLDDLCAEHPDLSRSEVRRAVLEGNDEAGISAFEFCEEFSWGSAPKREDHFAHTNMRLALKAAGMAVSLAAWRVQEKAEELARKAVTDIDKEMASGLDEHCAQLKVFGSYCGLLRSCAEEDASDTLGARDAHHVAEAFNLLHAAVFGGGGWFGVHYFLRAKDADGVVEDTECAPCLANMVELSANEVSFHHPFHGEFSQQAETLGGDTVLLIASLCHLGNYFDNSRDGVAEWFYYDI